LENNHEHERTYPNGAERALQSLGRTAAFIFVASYNHHQEHLEKLLAWLQEHGNMQIDGDIMSLDHPPFGKAEMLIRKPAAEVFEAFVNPAITSRFWFTKSSGRLEPGKQNLR
jgi:hypothetical protein